MDENKKDLFVSPDGTLTEEVSKGKKKPHKILSEDDKQFNRNKWLFTTGGIGRDMLYTLVSTYFLQYVQFGLTLTIAQFATLSLCIGILGRIWDGINDPMMGAIIDGCHFKWGKFKPWIFWGAIADAIFTILLFNIRPTGWTYVFVIMAVYLVWEATFTMNDIGYWSMIPSLSRTKERRDKLTTLTIFFAGIGAILMTALVTFFTPGRLLDAYCIYSIVAAVCVVGCQTMTAFGVKEAPRNQSEEKPENKVSFKRMIQTIAKNKQLLWMSLCLLFYSVSSAMLFALAYNLYYLEVGYDGMMIVFIVIYALCNTVVQLIYPKMAEKLGRKKIQTISLIVVCAGYLGLALIGWVSWLPFTLITMCIFALPVFIGSTWFYTATLVNMSNCVEYNEYICGERQEAVISTMRPLIVKFSDAIKYLFVLIVLVSSGLYALSKNISSLETQVSMYDKLETLEDRVYYVEKIKEYSSELDSIVARFGEDSDEYVAKISEIDSEIKSDSILEETQIEATYIQTIAKGYIIDCDDSGSSIYYSYQINDPTFNPATVMTDSSANYDFCFKFDKYVNKDGVVVESENTATAVYAEQRKLSTRIILRAAVTVLPTALLLTSWILQRKKFIIDEDYFDFMVAEIKKRKEAAAEETKSIE